MARANRSIVNSKPKPFISTWKTDNLSATASAANQITLPLALTGSYNFMVYWGDNTSSSISSALQPEVTHSYATAGTYNVTMSGYIKGFQFSNGRDRRKIINISQWGGLKLSSAVGAFFGCDALTLNNVTDTPNLYVANYNGLSGPTLSATFRSCSLITSISRANEWDTSKVDVMAQTFFAANRFNQNIGNWNTSNVTNLSLIFCGPAPAFTHSFNNGNSDSIRNWDTSKVNNFNGVFFYNPNFNQPVGDWNVSSGSNFNNMFTFSTGFNQPLNNWSTSNAVSMSQMFLSASSFNQPLNNWDTSKVVTMASMFGSAFNFNQDIGSWNVSNVNNFNNMFGGTAARTGSFNNGGADTLKNWNTSNATNMGFMFFMQPSFNQNIGTWDTSKVQFMNAMFNVNPNLGLTGSFNNGGSPSINNWNTSNVTTMNFMMNIQTKFNQPIGNWDVSKVTNFANFLNIPNTPNNTDGVFNQDLSTWNPISASTFAFMLNGQPDFNSNIGNWNFNSATTLRGMLQGQLPPRKPSAFNNGGSDSIKNWNLPNVTDINSLFQYNYGFNQPLTNWNISNVTTATSFMIGKSTADYSSANYDALLIGWASRPVRPNVSINFGSIQYTAAASASRAILRSAPNNWTIADGGQI
jgi:surface protein